jgi:hypothetical protein
MSQSDYIKYKKVSRELKINKLNPILDSQEYIDYKQYALENTTPTRPNYVYNGGTSTTTNGKLSYNQLVPANKKIIFGIERSRTTTCPTFTLCTNTNQRTNRRALLQPQIDPRPLRPLTDKELATPLSSSQFCQCINV